MTEAPTAAAAAIDGDITEVETLPEELIFEDAESTPEDKTAVPSLVRTAAFLADGRTSTFLLAETVAALVSHQEILSAFVDISTEAGLVTAHQLLEAGIDYSIFDTVPPKWDLTTRPLVDRVLTKSRGTVPFDPGNIAAIDANIVLTPAPASDAGPGIDATDGTITAVVMEQLKAAEMNCLLVLPPESGLRRQNDGSYVRLTLKVSE
ncbi:UNVERIFIED_ORG: hypothetical protein ABIB52_000755 [Arthrobacter sp. UYCu721]